MFFSTKMCVATIMVLALTLSPQGTVDAGHFSSNSWWEICPERDRNMYALGRTPRHSASVCQGINLWIASVLCTAGKLPVRSN
ncbi:hypothetical protein CFC21_100421 [Triticum aestivum]|uniref:Secreted protein n=2 Tax=Triticum aestivum TaxID=4565 RepID=A0A3B6RPF0_WHEAT|nr:hypothetical protein CFC21_100421 [Triticum aestivum]